MAGLERDHMCVDLRLLDPDLPQQPRKLAAGLAAPCGEDVGEDLDQVLGRRRCGVEMPGAEIPLLENQDAGGLRQPLECGHLLVPASERSDLETGVDEIEGVRLQPAVEKVVDD